MKLLIFFAVFIILLLLPQVIKRGIYKRLTTHLAKRDYEAFYTLLDGFLCTFSFRPFNREYMRLTACFMQNDVQKIDEQLHNIFKRLKMKEEQKSSVAKRGFYFYLENKDYPKAKKMLDIYQRNNGNESELHIMELMYSILALRKSDYIQEIKERLQSLEQQPNATINTAQQVRIGIFEYLLGLQYAYQNNKKTSKRYLESASKHCENTPYEREILLLLQQKG